MRVPLNLKHQERAIFPRLGTRPLYVTHQGLYPAFTSNKASQDHLAHHRQTLGPSKHPHRSCSYMGAHPCTLYPIGSPKAPQSQPIANTAQSGWGTAECENCLARLESSGGPEQKRRQGRPPAERLPTSGLFPQSQPPQGLYRKREAHPRRRRRRLLDSSFRTSLCLLPSGSPKQMGKALFV